MLAFFSAVKDHLRSGGVCAKLGRALVDWVVPALIAWSPAFFTGAMIDRYAVDIPVWDDFERVPLIEKFEEGELTASFLVSPHIEHRILIPRLIILANHAWGGGDLRNEVWIIYLSMMVSSFCVAWLIYRTVGRSVLGWVLVLMANLTIFTLIQYENLCWAIQTGMLLPQMFLCLTLVALHSSLGVWKKGLLALLGAVAASFCFTHGLIVWLVGFAYLLLGPGPEKLKTRLSVSALWVALMAGFFAFYFHDLSSTSSAAHSYFQKPGETPPGLSGLLAGDSDLDQVREYALKALGSQFSRFAIHPPRYLAVKTGFFQAVLFLLLAMLGVFLVLRIRRSKGGNEAAKIWGDLLPWLAMGGYVGITVLVMGLGRAHIAVNRAMAPRYVSITLYLTVAILMLGPLIYRIVAGERKRWVAVGMPVGYVLAGAFVSLQVWNQAYGGESLRLWNAARWQSLMVLAFPDFLPPQYEKRLDFRASDARESVERLKSVGGFEVLPDPVGTDDFGFFKVSSKSLGERRAGILGIRKQGKTWELTGFADTRSFLGRVPDGILFTVIDPASGDRAIVGYGETVSTMSYYVNDWDFELELVKAQSLQAQTRWEGRISATHLPDNVSPPVEIEAWAIDFEKRRLHQIEETMPLPLDSR
ncbi:MAG: hypothetical protein KDN19_04320 [Verrucomicrobiae bacterium]|nr:hypothetical protein [Verrucomicrobiae bacterium]